MAKKVKTVRAWAWQSKETGELVWHENQDGWDELCTARTRWDAVTRGVDRPNYIIVPVEIRALPQRRKKARK